MREPGPRRNRDRIGTMVRPPGDFPRSAGDFPLTCGASAWGTVEGVMFTAQTRPDQLAEAFELLRRVSTGHAAVSLNAMPYVLSVRHLVGDGEVLLRTNYGMDDDRLLDGTVVAYEAHVLVGTPGDHPETWCAEVGGEPGSTPSDSAHPEGRPAEDGGNAAAEAAGAAGDGSAEVWTVQLIGVARSFSPTEEEQRRFGPPPTFDDGHDTPVHIRLTPRFASVRHSRGHLLRR